MTTQAMTGPRIAAPRTDTEQRMNALLTAQAAARRGWAWLRAIPRRAADFVMDALHLRPAIASARTVTDPVTYRLRQALHLVGPVETAALMASTKTGQSIVKATAGRALRWIGKGASALYNGSLWAMRLFGKTGDKVATNVDSWVCDRVFQPVLMAYLKAEPELKKNLDPSSDGARAVKVIALWSAARRIIFRFLPNPWNTVAMIAATIVLGRRNADLVEDASKTIQGEVVTEPVAAETVLVDGEEHTVMPVSGTATVTGPQGGTYEVPVTGVAVPADSAERLPETMADVVVTATAVSPDGDAEDTVAVVPNREARRATEKLEKKGGKQTTTARR